MLMLSMVGAVLSASCCRADSCSPSSGGGVGWVTETSMTMDALAASPFLSLAVTVRETCSPEMAVPS